MKSSKIKISDETLKHFIESISDETKKKDTLDLIEIMHEVTLINPKLISGGIIAFGKYHYKYESGHEGDSCLLGFSPCKAAISIYLAPYFAEQTKEIKELGKFKLGKGCLYINKLADVDTKVLKALFKKSVEHIKKMYPES